LRDGAKPVGFFLFFDWHRPIQNPVFEACVGRSIPCFMTTSLWLLRALAPAVVVVSDAPEGKMQSFRSQLPGTKIINTRHGLSDKNYAFYSAGTVDHVCVSSPDVAADYVSRGLFEPSRFWVTGYPQLDPLFSRLKKATRATGGRTVLFAPTFNKTLSAGLRLNVDAVKAIRGEDHSICVVIRPHPNMRIWNGELLTQWRAQAMQSPNVEYLDDPDLDLAEVMFRSDVLVSDVSSVALSYLALNRPIVCTELGEEERTSPFFAPDAVEWRLREAADVASRKTLASLVRAALAEPERHAASRAKLRTYLFGDLTDGRSGIRIARRIQALRERSA
jgi:CDP-glycerol glycerophosphotransferase (TagB/SpsB family)